MFRAGAEQRLVPVGESACRWVRLEVRAQPFFLRRPGVAAANFRTFAVQHDDVPGAQLVAVITLFWITGIRAEVVEVSSGAAGMKFMIANRWVCSGFLASPRGVIAFGKLLGRALFVSVVACGEYRARNRLEKLGGRFSAGKIRAVGNIARTDENNGLITLLLPQGGVVPRDNIKMAQTDSKIRESLDVGFIACVFPNAHFRQLRTRAGGIIAVGDTSGSRLSMWGGNTRAGQRKSCCQCRNRRLR